MTNKVVITGGAGFIGTNLAEALVAAGHEVVVLDDLSAGDADRLPDSVTFIKEDVRNTAVVEEACAGAAAVVHLAAQPQVQFSIEHPVESHDVNVNGTLSVLEAARSTGVKRFVFAASAAAYGDQEVLPLSTDLPNTPKSPYAQHKVIGEQYCKLWHELYGLETVSLRFFNVYGPHLDPDGPYALVTGRFLKQAAAAEPLTITGDGEQTRDFIHVLDVCRAVQQAMSLDTVGHGEILNVGSGEKTSINTLARLISDKTTHIAPRIEPRHSVADISQTIEVLDWRPTVGLDEGLAKMKADFLG